MATQPAGKGLMLRSGKNVPSPEEPKAPMLESDMDQAPNNGDDRNACTSGQGESEPTTKKLSRKEQDIKRRQAPYPYIADDPEPFPKDGQKKDLPGYQKESREYSHQLLVSFKKTRVTGEVFWRLFQSSFRPHTLDAWTKPMMIEWIDLLLARKIFVSTDRTRPMKENIIDLLYRDSHCTTEEPATEAPGNQGHVSKVQFTPVRPAKAHTEDNQGSTVRDHINDANEREIVPDLGCSVMSKSEKVGIPYEAEARTDPDVGSEPSSSSSSDDEQGYPRHASNGTSRKTQHSNPHPKGTTDIVDDDDEIGLGTHGRDLVKAYIGQQTFSGQYEEDLEEVLDVYNELAIMCGASQRQKRNAMAIMLKGPARARFARHASELPTYDKAIKALRSWYSNKEKQDRLLTEWQGMTLSRYMRDEPEKSEIAVFQKFSARAMAIQNQLSDGYKGDRYLRDRLKESVDIPDIQAFLKDRPPRSSQQLINRVANRLSDRNGSAGSTHANWAVTAGSSREDTDALYTLGQKYGGEARRHVKGFVRQRGRGRRQDNYNRPSRGPPRWMQGIKGCFVCKENHRASDHHSREEVTKAVNKLKAKQPAAFLSSDEIAYISELFEEHDDVEQDGLDSGTDDEANIVDTSDSDEDESDFGFIADSSLYEIANHLADNSFIHGISLKQTGITGSAYLLEPQRMANTADTEFEGIRIDTCANKVSIMDIKQYHAYCVAFGLGPAIRPSGGKTVKGIGGRQDSVGVVRIQIPFIDLRLIIDVDFLLVDNDAPSLLSMRDMVINNLDISIQRRTILFEKREQKLQMRNFFLIHNWRPTDLPYALYTEKELRRIHRSFGHPAVGATENLLKRAAGGAITSETRDCVRRIAESCDICKKHASAPRRFRLTVGSSDLKFNHHVEVDTMFLDNRPVLHMIDIATHFCAASFLRKQSSEEVWATMLRSWMLMYCGPPDHLHFDQGSNYVSREMRSNLEAEGVTLHEAPIETPEAIGTIERYHAPLRASYHKIRNDMERSTSDADCLKMAVFSVNSTIGPEGLCPMLLVFGTLPRPARTKPSATQLRRAEVINAAMKEVERIQSSRRISYGLRHSKGSKGSEASAKLRTLPAGSPVYVYRRTSKSWEGPFTFINIQGETAVVQTNRGRRIFRSLSIKPVTGSTLDEEEAMIAADARPDDKDPSTRTFKAAKLTRNEKERIASSEFMESRKSELNGLIEAGTFMTIPKHAVPEGMRIYGSRFVDAIKQVGEKERRKSRLVAQNYSDQQAASIATKAPTVQKASQRLLLALAASHPHCELFTRDVTQAYIQSEQALERNVYIHAPAELCLAPDTVLQVVKPLYGIPESGLYWYLTYLHYHEEVLGMKRSKLDPCMMMRHDDEGMLEGLIILQVDDSLALATNEFARKEESGAKNFKSKPRSPITDAPTIFNGVEIRKEGNAVTIRQPTKIDKLCLPTTDEEFTSKRAMAQYIGNNCRPDVCAPVQLVAPTNNESTDDEYKSLNKAITHLKSTRDVGLKFTGIDLSTAKIILYTDASFANAKGLRSQLGFVVTLADDNGRANILHYGSSRCKRVTRSVMASEVHALLLGFDNAFCLATMVGEILSREVKIEVMIDSKTVFDVIAKDGKTTEKRLLIDIHSLKESYAKGEIAKLAWIPGASNPADGLTKNEVKEVSPLMTLMKTNRVIFNPIGWATRNSHENQNPQVSN